MDNDPEIERLRASLTEVIDEVRTVLGTDRWRLWPNDNTMVIGHAAAGLAHCCALAEELRAAHARGSELAGRVLTRALLEAWAIAYYISLGGTDALSAVSGAYTHALRRQEAEARRHDSELDDRRRSVRRRNKRMAKKNGQLAQYNLTHADSPKPLMDLVPEPAGVPINWPHSLDGTDLRPPGGAPLPLSIVMERLRTLTRDAGEEQTFEAVYILAYRGLSTFGSHTTLFVLDSYLDDQGGQSNMFSVRPDANTRRSFELPDLHLATILISSLAINVLGDRGADCAAAKAAYEFGEGLALNNGGTYR